MRDVVIATVHALFYQLDCQVNRRFRCIR
jgi:hypothetical protein